MTYRQRNIALVGAAVLLIACLVAITRVLRSFKAPLEPAPLTDADARQLIASKNLAVGHLENHDTARSIPIFEEIAARLAAEPLGPRNLAVSRLLALGEEYENTTPQRIETANAALAMVERAEGQSPTWHWLSARAKAAAGEFAAAEKHMLQVIAADKGDASAWYELFLVRQAANRGSARGSASAALQQAFELQPDNLFLLVEYLRQLEERVREQQAEIERLPADQQLVARRRAIAEYGNLAARLRQSRQTLLPFQDRVNVFSGVDVVQLMDEALMAAKDGNLSQLGDRAGQVARVALGMAAADRNQVRRHVLEFVLFNFRPEFYEQYGLLEAEPAPAIEVSFVAPPELQIAQDFLQTLSDVETVEVADFDLDGRQDIVVLDARGVHVISRATETAAEHWRLLASSPAAGMTGLVVADLDLDFEETPNELSNDATATKDTDVARACPSADVDIVAFGPQGIVVFRNRYSPATRRRALERIEQVIDNQKGATAATVADLDGDGDLDLVVAGDSGLSIWSNRGNGTFEDISQRSARPPADAAITGLVAADWDRDVDIDILASGEQAGWFENLRHGQMRWQPFGAAFSGLKSARSLDVVDADANASWDLLAATTEGMRLERTTTPQPGVIRPLAADSISDRAAQRLHTFDYDNDGLLDLLAWDDAGVAMYRALSGGRYQAVGLIDAPQGTRDCRSGDLDGDGDLDLVVATGDEIRWFVNQGGNQNHWLDVALKARQIKGSETSASGRVNAHGIGSLLELKAGTRYQPAVVRGQTTHFGLGREAAADVVRVVWLNGVPQNILQPRAEQAVCEQQLLTGSCPYLYTWNGAAFEFVTDLLWASPLGLQAADGVLLPWREWEYIKIPGEKLVAQNGKYLLQLTEELWEAAYFDEVKLIAVDHPAEVDIYSNEKVGPADIAHYKIHTAREKRQPVAARNHRGRDALRDLLEQDGVYARPFDNKLRQGLVEEHYVELDLGDLRNAKHVTLFLTGWIYPSGTSLNVAISQNPDLPQPRPPALLVPDGAGGWQEALAYMGFPGGKTKTIAVDLTGLLPKNDSRLRIATNLELYWDHIFFTVDEPPADVRTIELELHTADLHYRGFSRVVHDVGDGPERFPYDQVATAPKWPPMQGRFTRFGDVSELLRERDDQLVVMGAGDELTLDFGVPATDPAPGWKRDFLLYSVGWDKDANLCTVLGQTVEPFPFAAMTSYPPSTNDRPPESAEYGRYLREYQTRTQTSAFWRIPRSPPHRPGSQ